MKTTMLSVLSDTRKALVLAKRRGLKINVSGRVWSDELEASVSLAEALLSGLGKSRRTKSEQETFDCLLLQASTKRGEKYKTHLPCGISTRTVNQFLDLTDKRQKALDTINSIRVTWTDKFGNKEDNLYQTGVWADVFWNKNRPMRCAEEARRALSEYRSVGYKPLLDTHRAKWVKEYKKVVADTKKQLPRLLRRACDVTALVKEASKPYWDDFNAAQDEITLIVDMYPDIWINVYYKELNTELNEFLTWGETSSEDFRLVETDTNLADNEFKLNSKFIEVTQSIDKQESFLKNLFRKETLVKKCKEDDIDYMSSVLREVEGRRM